MRRLRSRKEAPIASIRDGLLALLTQGPAYGLLLRNELASRTARETPLNVGQVYTTLERLQSAGLVIQVHDAEDGLPRYVLTEAGAGAAAGWLRTPAIDVATPWESMRFQLLLARSLPGVSSAELVAGYRDFWISQGADSPEAEAGLAGAANTILAGAAFEWLALVEASSDAGQPIQVTRPRRGRPAGPARR